MALKTGDLGHLIPYEIKVNLEDNKIARPPENHSVMPTKANSRAKAAAPANPSMVVGISHKLA